MRRRPAVLGAGDPAWCSAKGSLRPHLDPHLGGAAGYDRTEMLLVSTTVSTSSERTRGGSMRKTAFVLTSTLVTAMTMAVAPLSGATAPAPAGLPSFYAVPSFSAKAPLGTVLKDQAVTVSGLSGTAYRVMYVSENVAGKRVPATGYVVVPTGTAPKGGWPVLNWNHGTNGMTSVCAPSLNIGSDVPVALINAATAHGWEFTAADYQGEGTAGLMPYLAGVEAAQDSINVVRAAHRLTVAHGSTTYVDWGHSEGGQTAMFVDAIAKHYAPELTLKGVVAGASPSQFQFIYGALKTSPFAYYLLMGAAGLNAWYGDKLAPLSQVLTPTAEALLPDLSMGCSNVIAGAVDPYVTNNDFAALVKADPYTLPAWKAVLNANDPAKISALGAPLLMIQGGNDEQIPVVSTGLLYNQMCHLSAKNRSTVQRWVYPGQSHAGVISVSYQDMYTWIADQFASNRTGAFNYTPVGLDGIAPSASVKDSGGFSELQSCQ